MGLNIYVIKSRLSKKKLIRMLKDHFSGLEQLGLHDFVIKYFKGIWFIKFYHLDYRIEMWFRNWSGKTGFRLDFFVWDEERGSYRKFDDVFVHVAQDYLVENGLVEEVKA